MAWLSGLLTERALIVSHGRVGLALRGSWLHDDLGAVFSSDWDLGIVSTVNFA